MSIYDLIPALMRALATVKWPFLHAMCKAVSSSTFLVLKRKPIANQLKELDIPFHLNRKENDAYEELGLLLLPYMRGSSYG